MNTYAQTDRAQAYLRAELGEHPPHHTGHAAGPYITISRQCGSGGSSLANLIARALNRTARADGAWKVYDGNIITAMLNSNGMDPRLEKFLPEDHVPELDASIGELVGLHPNLYQLVQRTNETMVELATKGYVILVGRGSNFACERLPNGMNLRLVASTAFRARNTARSRGISVAAAEAFNAAQDAARARYVRTTFDRDIDEASAYDLTLNMERVAMDRAVEIVLSVARDRLVLSLAETT